MLCDCAVKADEPTKGHRAKNLKERHEKGCLLNISALGYFFSYFGNVQNINQRHPVGLFHGSTNIQSIGIISLSYHQLASVFG